jgi:ribosomal protein S12 methylthiotransferase
MIDDIRAREPDSVFRSSFIVGFPGEQEADHEALLSFLADAQLDWAGFFAFSREDGTPAATMEGEVADALVRERLRECADVQDPITAAARTALVGTTVDVLVDGRDDDGVLMGRSHREAPEIDGVVRLVGTDTDGAFARPGALVAATVAAAVGPDLEAAPLGEARRVREVAS